MVIASSISGLPIYAPSAGFAPTNSADVSAIASAYQVVSATATQLYAGTAYVTSVNDAPISAARAGNAANSVLATSAWYDGTGRLISSLPDEATVSSIASAYAESAASGKLDKTAQVVSATGTELYNGTYYLTSVNDNQLSAKYAVSASSATAAFYARYDRQGGVVRYLSSLPGSAEVSAIASSYVESGVSSKQDTLSFAYNTADQISSINGSALGGMDEAAVSGIASAYAESAVSGKADSSALSSYVPYSSIGYNTASAISGINGSALAAGSTYSAGEGIDITDDVISVEAPVDVVAGPGIVIDNPDGNTLRVSMGIAGSWIDVKTEASYNTTNINAGSFKIMYNPALNLVALNCDANVGAGESTFFTWTNRLKPVFNDMALGSNLYVGQSGLKQAAGSTSRWINGAFMWPVVGGN